MSAHRAVLHAAGRAHDVARLVVCLAITLLFTGITIRFALGGGGIELVFLAAITVALVFLTRHCYRRVRRPDGDAAVERLP